MTSYLRKRGKKFHFRKRVPKDLQGLFSRDVVQVPLNTDSEAVALQRASNFNLILEEFWNGLVGLDELHAAQKFSQMVLRAKLEGFQFIPKKELVDQTPVREFVNRINFADSLTDNTAKAIVLGGIQPASINLSKAKDEYLVHEEGNLGHYSPGQIQKWKNPRKKAVKNFISVVGNKPLDKIMRSDVIEFRTWWVNRIKEAELTANSANKEFGYVKQIIGFGVNNHALNLNVDQLFKDVRLKEVEKISRYPFPIEFIKDVLLNPGQSGLNSEAQLFIFAMADTGARIGELTGLEDEDVILDAEIPHIKIRPNRTRTLKTPQSERDLPLVGASLYAFKTLGGPFDHYRGKPDLVSTTINKFFRQNGLFPSQHHSLYSLRHSFEDRLTAVEPPDKVQAALMGHKYARPRYGHGPTLEQKKLWLDKIAFTLV